jgi:hypothetical protein
VLLFTTSEAEAARGYEAVLAAVRSGRISRARVEASYRRIVALKDRLSG